MGHDGYLKLSALGNPVLDAQYMMLDEAQDTNPVVLGVLRNQRSQVAYVGDRHQQIYEWRGAVNAMDEVQGCEETSLTQSFRFGAPIADAASKVLRTLGERNPLRGNPAVSSCIVKGSTPTEAVLARTNATVMLEAMEAIAAGRAPHILGGTSELRNLLGDVFRLQKNESAISQQFFGFRNWREVVALSSNEEGESIRSFVQMVEKHGASELWNALKSLHDDEGSADVVLSTAHKAKGRQWRSVRLARDFASSRATADREQSDPLNLRGAPVPRWAFGGLREARARKALNRRTRSGSEFGGNDSRPEAGTVSPTRASRIEAS
jgi:superfamily I DNA/RNA helicase